MVVPAICNEKGSPFGKTDLCGTVGLSYASFSMALGGFFIWSYTYHLIRTSGIRFREIQVTKDYNSMIPCNDLDANEETSLLKGQVPELVVQEDAENQVIVPHLSSELNKPGTVLDKVTMVLHQIVEELLAPPTIAAIVGFAFGATPWLKNLIIGEAAPLRVIQDSIKLLGDGTIPCITLILGGNLTQGLRSSRIKPLV
ncbi:AEC family transporter, partial [Ralstonia pseudosolanacearum]